MKLLNLFTLSLLSSASAFTPSSNGPSKSTCLEMMKGESSRMDFLKSVVSMGGMAVIGAGPANAAKYGSFGAGSPEVLDPKSAIIDDEILATDAVQKSITSLKQYLTTIESMASTLKSDSQADIGPIIRKDLDFVSLRVDLNTFNSAFDEDTQRGTDRLVRIILQDITELETANKQKDGIARSERRLAIMNGKLEKLDKAFSELLAFL